jgi:hypothetical protein
VSDRFSDPGWWPTPPPRPQQPLGSQVAGWFLPLLAVGGIVVGLTLLLNPHHGATHQATSHGCTQATVGCGAAAPAPGPAVPQSRAQAPRQAFNDCMRQNGGGSRSSGHARDAFAICRSLVGPGRVRTTPLASTSTTASPPVA